MTGQESEGDYLKKKYACGQAFKDEFKDSKEVRELIGDIPNSCKTMISKEMAIERFTCEYRISRPKHAK